MRKLSDRTLFVLIDPKNNEVLSFFYAHFNPPENKLKAPDKPGRYKVVYKTNGGRILSRTALEVAPGKR